jgi:hypothetical protein
MSDRYARAPWAPGQVIKYRDTGELYNEAPVYLVETAPSDGLASLGLEGVYYSDSYRIAEIERHLHSFERWFGVGGQTLTPFTIDSGNNDWGAWVAILAAGDTPAIAGSVYYDPHRIEVVATERNTPYRVQLAFGATGAAALTAGQYTEIIFSPASNLVDAGPQNVHSRRIAAGTPLWARCWNAGDTATLTFFLGIHEYEG